MAFFATDVPLRQSPAPKPGRTLTYDPTVGALHMREGGKELASYWLDTLTAAAPHARAYRLTKFVASRNDQPESYDVQVNLASGEADCPCRGFRRWGHCRHASAVLACHAAGKLS